MPDDVHRRRLSALLDSLECGVALPKSWAEFFSARGAIGGTLEDTRRMARFHLRGKAVMQLSQTLPNIHRDHGYYCVYTKDVSRTGMAFLHTTQLYPSERIQLWLSTGKFGAVVCRCRRQNEKCFEIGVTFDSSAA